MLVQATAIRSTMNPHNVPHTTDKLAPSKPGLQAPGPNISDSELLVNASGARPSSPPCQLRDPRGLARQRPHSAGRIQTTVSTAPPAGWDRRRTGGPARSLTSPGRRSAPSRSHPRGARAQRKPLAQVLARDRERYLHKATRTRGRLHSCLYMRVGGFPRELPYLTASTIVPMRMKTLSRTIAAVSSITRIWVLASKRAEVSR